MAPQIAKLTSCEVWIDRGDNHIKFFGLTSDVTFAEWLLTSFIDLTERWANQYTSKRLQEQGERGNAEQIKHDFLIGCLERVARRMKDAAMPVQNTSSATSKTDIATGDKTRTDVAMVDKKGLVRAEFAKLGLQLRKGSRRKYSAQDGRALEDGRSAGDRASWNRPVNGGGAVLNIGKQ